MTNFYHITTRKKVSLFQETRDVFSGLISEMRDLSKKKADATLSAKKVEIINRVLDDLIFVFKDEPESRFLERLDEDTLPQNSDVVLIMVQFEKCLKVFPDRYIDHADGPKGYDKYWITEEFLQENRQDNEKDI